MLKIVTLKLKMLGILTIVLNYTFGKLTVLMIYLGQILEKITALIVKIMVMHTQMLIR